METSGVRLEIRINSDFRAVIGAQIAQLDHQIDRAVTAIIQGRITETEASSHLPRLRQRKAELIADLGNAAISPKVVRLESSAIDAYLRDLEHLETVINSDLTDGDQTAARAIREIIETVTITPTPAGSVPGVIVRGELGSLLGASASARGVHVGGAGGAG